MAHHHHHHDDNYFLDQLCLIALSGAFAFICLSMYFWQTSMLSLLLGPQFHPFVLASGIALLVLVVVRAAALWRLTGQQKALSAHTHAHGELIHAHTHDCDHHHHDHHHDLANGDCDHVHEHGHHEHDHEHDWAPWRYVVLLVPVMLFLLGLPNKGPAARIDQNIITYDQEAFAGTLVSTAPTLLTQLGFLAAEKGNDTLGNPDITDYKMLEKLGYLSDADREYWNGKVALVRGQFVPNPINDRAFTLVRFRIGCCAADAIQLNVPIMCKESVSGANPNDWVQVKGRIEFYPRPTGGFQTVVIVPSREYITVIPPDNDPYVQ